MDTLTLTGDLTPDDAQQLNNMLNIVQALTIDLSEADFLDGATMAAFTRTLKDALVAGRTIVLHAPPQLLVHNLYRVGIYPHPQLVVHELRQDEATSS